MTSQAYTLSQIVSQLGGEWKGEDIAITAVRPLDQAQAEHISFLANPKYKEKITVSPKKTESDSQRGDKLKEIMESPRDVLEDLRDED